MDHELMRRRQLERQAAKLAKAQQSVPAEDGGALVSADTKEALKIAGGLAAKAAQWTARKSAEAAAAAAEAAMRARLEREAARKENEAAAAEAARLEAQRPDASREPAPEPQAPEPDELSRAPAVQAEQPEQGERELSDPEVVPLAEGVWIETVAEVLEPERVDLSELEAPARDEGAAAVPAAEVVALPTESAVPVAHQARAARRFPPVRILAGAGAMVAALGLGVWWFGRTPEAPAPAPVHAKRDAPMPAPVAPAPTPALEAQAPQQPVQEPVAAQEPAPAQEQEPSEPVLEAPPAAPVVAAKQRKSETAAAAKPARKEVAKEPARERKGAPAPASKKAQAQPEWQDKAERDMEAWADQMGL